MRKKMYELHSDLFRPSPFAAWAKPKKADLNIARTKHLGDNNEVIWQIKKDGVNTADHIEMSGFYASAIISYGNDKNSRLRLMKHLTVPTLRIQPNATSSSFSHNFNDDNFTVTVNDKKAIEYPNEISIKGNLKITSSTDFDTEITREFLPAVNQPALIEIIHIFNKSKSVRNCKITAHKYSKSTNAFWCVGEKITAESSVLFDDKFKKSENRSHEYTLNPNENCCFCITYDALGNAAILADITGDDLHKSEWLKEQKNLKTAIENYFGANVEGFDTYRYYDGNTDLRSWICMPLTVEIFDRAEETVNALFSDKLYYDGMMRSTSEHDTTWDRSLLFALRGTFLASKAEKGIKETINYCKNRLLGSHSPYPYEAYHEGNRAHLAAESLLFARVITEGLFGLRATGLNKLRIKPQLSEKCPEMALNNIKLFSKCFDIKADKNGITVIYDGSNYHTDSLNTVFCFNTHSFVQKNSNN